LVFRFLYSLPFHFGSTKMSQTLFTGSGHASITHDDHIPGGKAVEV
jgi:hypothetical protein